MALNLYRVMLTWVMAGPVAGGFLSHAKGWRWMFVSASTVVVHHVTQAADCGDSM